MRYDAGEVITAMVTPFNEKREVDYDKVEALAAHLVETGSDAVLVDGTTGETPTLTFEEELPYNHPLALKFKTPQKFDLHTLDECIAATKQMPWDEEGYVVVDKNFNRVKVKSPSYVAAHNLKGNGVMSYARAIELVRSNEIDEVCNYFEEFRSALEECKERFWKLVHETETSWNEYLKVDSELLTRKDKAVWITKNFKFPGAAFCLLDKKVASVKDFFMQIPAVKLLSYLNYKDV